MAETICPNCKATNSTTARYCSECGAALLANVPPAASGESPTGEPGLAAGKQLQGRYRIQAELGRGGFGAVYRAWDVSLDRPCAVKENLNTTPEAQRQFTREATVLANLSHPNLPRVTDHFFIPGEGQYLVMDFAEGDDLFSKMPKGEPLEQAQALGWILQVLDALAYLHGRQPPVLHRDIKPANIRISPEGKAMLVDFGLVKMYDPTNQTTLGARAVTPGYAPPEQYGRGSTDARSDLYAVGATLYRMLSGQEPPESVHRMTGEPLRPVHELNPKIPPGLSAIVARALAIDPAQRYQTAAEFRTDLEQLRVALAAGAAPALIQPPRPAAAAQPAAAPQPLSAAPPPSARPASAQAAPKPAPVARTVAVETPLVAAPERTTGAPPTAQRGSGLPWLLGLGAFLVILFCLGGGLALVGVSQMGQDTPDASVTLAADQTEAAGAQETLESDRATWTVDADLFALQRTATAALAEQATQLAILTEVAATDAFTPSAEASATVEPSPTSNQLPDWPVLFEEDFETNDAGWNTGVLSENSAVFELVSAEVSNSTYSIELQSAKPNGGWWIAQDLMPTGQQFILSMTSRQTAGAPDGWRGVIFHREDSKNLYLYAISDAGLYSFWILLDDKWQELISPEPSTSIRPGRWNEITVVAYGGTYAFFINNNLVAEYDDSSLSGGDAGMYFETGSDSVATYEVNSLVLKAP